MKTLLFSFTTLAYALGSFLVALGFYAKKDSGQYAWFAIIIAVGVFFTALITFFFYFEIKDYNYSKKRKIIIYISYIVFFLVVFFISQMIIPLPSVFGFASFKW